MGVDDRLGVSLAPRMAYGIVTAVFATLAVVSVLSLLRVNEPPVQVALGAVYVAALLALQLGYISRPKLRFRPMPTAMVLTAQAALVYLPILQYGYTWVGVPGFLVGSLLVALTPKVAIPLAAGVVASIGGLGLRYDQDPLTVVHLMISVVITGLVVFGLTRLVRLVHELHAARGELARLAVAEERLRFARDVHDLLGLSLSAIALKCELADRLLKDHPDRARSELAEILAVSRRAMADARAVASGSRDLSFEEECQAARSLLSAADIDVRLEREVRDLPRPVGSVLATVLREGVTNVLRHSKAERCDITVRRVDRVALLEIVNDGVERDPQPSRGSGIRNLSHRVETLGGSLTAATESDGEFRLRAEVPLAGTVPVG
ncbi:sensor histidine kinase [Amycolatopsis arida]|uniref:sensor histidine kinase n=1 Tax=Amycolatopsis arida TaxID=587909 RepID=UPI001416F4EE|nr:histidine kinase [Amycolatopsis arida]